MKAPPSGDSCAVDGRWHHCIFTTYGAWLPGDPRGFRTRGHRDHVEGDYKNPPPPGKHAVQLKRNRRLLKQPAVRLSARWRQLIGAAIQDKLASKSCFVLCIAVAAQHVHVLAKLPKSAKPRTWMGLARKHASFEAHQQGWEGKLWAVRGNEIAIQGRPHQLAVYRYILKHKEQGAWVWDWRELNKPRDSHPWA